MILGKKIRLRTFLVALLVVTTLVTLGIVGSIVIAYRVPAVERETLQDVRREVSQMGDRVDAILGALEQRLSVAATARGLTARRDHQRLLDALVDDGREFNAVYFVSPAGIVQDVAMASGQRARRADILGSDLSANSLFRDAQKNERATWSDKYLSALSGTQTLGLAMPAADGSVLVAEVPLAYVLDTVRLSAGREGVAIWVIDRSGEIVADIGGTGAGGTNLLDLPALQAARGNMAVPDEMVYGGARFHVGVRHSTELNWTFVARAPAGFANPRVQLTLSVVVGAFVGALLLGLVLAPLWALRLVTPLRAIVTQARQVAAGRFDAEWPSGPIVEFNRLSADLSVMAQSLREREKKFLSIFNASPAPMMVSDVDHDFRFIDVNQAWCRQFGRERDAVLGRNGVEIGLWRSVSVRNEVIAEALCGSYSGEVWLMHADASPMLCLVSARLSEMDGRRMMIWAMEDITERRQMIEQLRDLNIELEARVEQRTQAVARSNAELSTTVEHLQRTQRELVRSEKMAALGSLVAGVAHELNTPIGNGLMAVSTLGDQEREFRKLAAAGLRRSDLDAFMASVEQATLIATRNLHRAADLVTSFKQVAADQTSSQRRQFELREVVDEIVMTLRPTLNRTPYEICVDVPPGLVLDSYPGALGQVLANLINNAVLHGFAGRDHGVVEIASSAQEGQALLCVRDDGKGVPAAMIDRIFEPFVTSRMGSGGTGLGLHISFNAVTNVLGGTLTVESVEGRGTAFTLRLPLVAPQGVSA